MGIWYYLIRLCLTIIAKGMTLSSNPLRMEQPCGTRGREDWLQKRSGRLAAGAAGLGKEFLELEINLGARPTVTAKASLNHASLVVLGALAPESRKCFHRHGALGLARPARLCAHRPHIRLKVGKILQV